MISLFRRARWLTALVALLLLMALSACGAHASDQTITIATVFPTSGVDAAVGQAMQNAVDLAVRQNGALGKGYTLAVAHIDEASGAPDQAVAIAATSSPHLVGVVGPLASQSAVAMLPVIAQQSIATISPGATLPGLTQSNQAQAEGLSFTQMHPAGKPLAFFRLPETDTSAGKVAADLAVASTQAHGLAAHAVFIVDDGSDAAKALTAAFTQELNAKHGSVAGQKSIIAGVPDSAQAAVTAIIEAYPDAVFYAGSTVVGAELRSTLTLTGAPQLPILTAGIITDHPAWSATVGMAAASANTTGILPAQDLSALKNSKDFISAYQAAYSGEKPLPQSALAYDAAMDEIAAIKSVIASGKPVTSAAVLAMVASTKYAGITGALAFDKNGDNTTPIGFSVYSCDTKGVWHYQTSLNG